MLTSWILAAVTSLAAAETELSSPDGQVVLRFSLAEADGASGRPVYSVQYRGQRIVSDCRLGLELQVLNLNDPCAIADTSSIKPGKVIREVTLTTAGGKACVDFAVRHHLQYVEFDAGWYGHEYSDESDARQVNVDPKRSPGPLDLHAVIRYADQRGIGILLYVNRRALERQLDEILPLYRQWGVKGVKYGFVQVGSQQWTRWLHAAVRKAAEHRLMVDIHDEYRPTGYSRTSPNLMTQEGIAGDETSPVNGLTLTILFTRMLAGAADNTICYYDQRVDRNASHAYQLAKSVALFSPWQFLYWYDRPPPAPLEKGGAGHARTVIGEEPELEFFDRLPTTWHDTRVLHGQIGQYAVIARRHGTEWYLGGMNSGTARTLDVPLSFLDKNRRYVAHVYADDPSVATRTHVKIERMSVDAGSVLKMTRRCTGGKEGRTAVAVQGGGTLRFSSFGGRVVIAARARRTGMIRFGQRTTLPVAKGTGNRGARMAKPTKKDLLRRRKELDRQRQVASDRARAAGITPWVEPLRPVPAPHVGFPTWPEPPPTPESPTEAASTLERAKEALAARKNPPPPPRERTEEEQQIDRWWQEYKHADGETRLQMAREKLAALEPDDEQFEAFFPDAISEVEPQLGRERYVAFLEEIRDRWPRVFSQEIDWNVWQMAFVYVADQRWPDLERAVGQMAEELKKVREPFFSLVSFLRLANRGCAAQRLADAAIRLQDSWDLMPWAVDDVYGWVLFQPYQEFVRAGATDEAFDRLWQKCLDLGGQDTQEAREHHRKFGLHLAGLANKRWTRQELLSTKNRSGIKVSLLLMDYEHWLCTARQVPSIVADEFRLILGEALQGMKDDVTGFLHGLKRTVFEPHLARKLDFLSLSRFHVPAGILAMYDFYDFLAETQLVEETIRQPSQRVCLDLWSEIKNLFQKEPCDWRPYQFLERYATWQGSAR